MAHIPSGKRIWPTLLSAAAQAAARGLHKVHDRSADTHAAVILSRTAFDAYLHELIVIRNIDRYVRFASGPGSRKRLSRVRWNLVSSTRSSIAGLAKREKKKYQDIRELTLESKIQTILLILVDNHSSALIADFENSFSPIIQLNWLRNAIVHHEFGPPSVHLTRMCTLISTSLHLPALDPHRPWEDLLTHAAVASWACKSVCGSILALESIGKKRAVHLATTRDIVASAMSPLTYE
jgi:hypothetical protein